MPSPLATVLRARLAALRDQLEHEYGWTRLEPTLSIIDDRVTLSGHVAAPSLAGRIREALDEVLPAHFSVELALTPLPVVAWHELDEPLTQLWRPHPSRADPHELATELWPSDGPIALLARDRGASLVRARDGTSGWTSALLGAPTMPRPLNAPEDHGDQAGARVLAAARAWLGTPYRLGGASREHIDCSALIQRALLDALGLLVPKNSNDQLACVGARPRELEREALGDLLFIHSRRERRTHVGLAGERETVIQASRTRSAVVETALTDYRSDAAWMVRVPLAEMIAWARTQIGRAALELPSRP